MPRWRPYFAKRALQFRRRVRQHCRDFCTGLEQARRLAIDHFEIPLLGSLRIVRIHELQHFALGNDVRGVGHDFHHALGAEPGHHLERPGVHEVAHQHAGLVAEDFIGGIPPRRMEGAIHHVVMQKRGRMDELDERRRLEVLLALAAAGPAG